MPTRTHDEQPPIEPPPALALEELALASFSPELRQDERDSTELLSGHSEPELLGLLAHDSLRQRLALSELYTRHARYLFTVAARATRGLDTDQLSDVVTDAFLAADGWARRQPDLQSVAARFSASDREAERRKVLGWLSVITRRIAVARAQEQSRTPVQRLDCDIAAPTNESEDAEPPPTPRLRALADALSNLSSDQLDALRESLPWYEPSTHEFAFPRGEAEQVAASLGITTDVLRQRRHRSLKRLHALLVSMTPE